MREAAAATLEFERTAADGATKRIDSGSLMAYASLAERVMLSRVLLRRSKASCCRRTALKPVQEEEVVSALSGRGYFLTCRKGRWLAVPCLGGVAFLPEVSD